MLQLLRPNSSNLPCLYSTFHLEYPLVLSRFCLVAFYDTLGIRRMYSRLNPPASSWGSSISHCPCVSLKVTNLGWFLEITVKGWSCVRAWTARAKIKLLHSTCSSMCRQIYFRHIVAYEVKQPVSLTQ